MMQHTRLLLLVTTFTLLLNTTVYGLTAFSDFSDTSALQLNGSAQVMQTTDGKILRLTPASTYQAGSAFSKAKVNASDFSTFFTFRISDAGGLIADCNTETGADGLVFIVQAVSSDIGGTGSGLGYEGIKNSIGIEFDTWCNAINNDISSNHVALVVNGHSTHDKTNIMIDMQEKLDDGELWYIWIDYKTQILEVRLSRTEQRPTEVTLTQTVDIPNLLGDVKTAYVGFSAATGAAYGDHDIINWEYRDHYEPVDNINLIPVTTCSTEELAVVREQTRQACQQDPASCGIAVATGTTGNVATLSSDLKLHIPWINYQVGLGITLPIQADLRFIPQDNSEEFWFKLEDYRVLEDEK